MAVKTLGLVALIAACGRIGFAPTTTGDGAIPMGDGQAPTGAGAAAPDGIASACAAAVDATVGIGSIQSNCDGTDVLDGCGPAGTKERIYRFIAPATAGYQLDALDATDANVLGHSIGILDATCAATTSCSAIIATPFDAGSVHYFMVEADAGGCTSFRVEIIQQ